MSLSPDPPQKSGYDLRGAGASLLFRLWGMASGPVQAALLIVLLTPQEQGIWYALSGLQRFQALLELGIEILRLALID